MALIAVNNVGVLSGTITMPLVGVWIADFVIDNPGGSGFDAGTKATIKVDGGLELNGTVVPGRSGDFLDATHVRIYGGAAGMAKTARPRGYSQPGAYVRDVVDGLMTDSGESLSSTVSSSLLSTNLVAWAVAQVPASQALTALIDTILPGSHWRILPDGKLWLGTESWGKAKASFDVLSQDPVQGTFELGVEAPEIVPGALIDGIGNIGRVEHYIAGDSIRTHVQVDIPGVGRGFREAIADIVRQETAYIDYYALYHAKVVTQSVDLSTVDLVPDDKRLPGLSKVPIRWGIPGITAQITGGNVLLGWSGGDPSKPFAMCFDQGSQYLFVNLGENAAPTEFALKGFTYRQQEITKDAAETAFMTALQTFVTAFQNDPATPVMLPATYTALQAFVPTVATYLGAIAAFEASASTYLSQKVRVE